ncbi:MAG: HNH endonuclease signature motif containing protein [Candidatus Woesearchaeota archaeon]|nr:HNH endonuclease signature motif containing protein [Candidatus Woesearchaeota archaeon]
MIKKSIISTILILHFILFSYPVLGLECQYTSNLEYSTEEEGWYLNNELLDGSPTQEIIGSNDNFESHKVYNPFEFPITVEISYATFSTWYGGSNGGITGVVPPKQYVTLISHHTADGQIRDLKFKIIEPSGIINKLELVKKNKLVCKECGGKVCMDDGLTCEINSECGSGKCIEKICSPNNYCYNNNCECSFFEVQSKDNTKCENNNIFFGLTFMAMLLIIGALIFIKIMREKRKTTQAKKEADVKVEKEKQITAEKEREKYDKELSVLKERQDAILRKEEELEELKRLSSLTKQEKENIQKLSEEITKETLEMEKNVKKRFAVSMEPYPSKYASHRRVFKNPYLGGYECFYEERLDPKKYSLSKLVHRWVWKKANGREPKQGYHIHHIDGDKYHNDAKNLEEIKGDEHYGLHRNERQIPPQS